MRNHAKGLQKSKQKSVHYDEDAIQEDKGEYYADLFGQREARLYKIILSKKDKR